MADFNIQKERIQHHLTNSTNQPTAFHFDVLNPEHIFHIDAIHKLCIDYRLRFLDTRYFKGDYPNEAFQKIKTLEQKHKTSIKNFKIIAPSKMFVLKEKDDPILFAPLGGDYYYFIHKWGKDIHPLRKLYMWPLQNMRNFSFILFLIATLLTIVTYRFFSSDIQNFGYMFCLWLFHVKGVFGIALFYGIASGKTFSKYCWQSKYNKV